MIRKATAEDLPRIGEIYEAIFDQEDRGPVYTNWLRGTYPSVENPRLELESANILGREAGDVLWGAVNLTGVQLPEYGKIPWTIPAQREEVGVIHTLCIHPGQSGKGYAKQMVAFCEETARKQGKTVIRLDTWEGNAPANHLYPSLGYRFAGGTEFFFQGYIHEILNCYEKKL